MASAARLSRLSTFAAAERATASRAAAAADPLNAGLAQLLTGRAAAFEPVPASLPVVDAAVLMARRKVGSLVVTEDGARATSPPAAFEAGGRSTASRRGSPAPVLRGIVTERDVLLAVPRLADGVGDERLRVADIMSRDPKTIEADQTIGDALEIMTENGFRHLPVTDGGSMVGVLSMRDVTTKITEDHKEAVTSLNVQLGRLSALGGEAADAAAEASATEGMRQADGSTKSWWRSFS